MLKSFFQEQIRKKGSGIQSGIGYDNSNFSCLVNINAGIEILIYELLVARINIIISSFLILVNQYSAGIIFKTWINIKNR